MRNIIKHPFINLVFLAALFAFSGCTNEMEPDIAGNGNLPADGTRLTVRATASGFQAPAQDGGGTPSTRTPVEDGLTTTFQPGDAIGLFCIRLAADGSTSISTDMRNLKLVYTQAADGTTAWKTEEGADGPVYYTDAQTYVAYYPYKPSLSTTANDEPALRTELIDLIGPNEDQSTPESLTASDLMIATGAPVTDASGKPTLTLNFKHENALLVIRPMSMNRCIVPAGATYSYHAEAKAWGIDKNITKTTEVSGTSVKCKMLVYDFIQACEMSDGSYRAIIPASSIIEQIFCNYTTSNGTSPLPVSATGTTIVGGIKANTCYTLEIHHNGVENATERALQPGDFVYQHNGKIEIYPCNGAVDVWGKIPDYQQAVGIVVTTDPARLTDAECNTKGWTHAYVMGLADISGKYSWANSDILVTSAIGMNDAGNDMNGYKMTETMLAKTPLSDYPAFQAIKDYRDSHAVPNNINRSPWFMPSIGQWFDLMANLGGKSPTKWESISDSGWWNETDDAPNMFDKINNQLDKVNIDDNVFFPNRTVRQNFYCSTSESVASNGTNGLWSLITMNDSYNNRRVLFVQISGQTKRGGCNIRPFFAF